MKVKPVDILGNTSTEANGEETLRIRYTKGSHGMRCATCMDYTSKDSSSQTKLTCQEHVPERIVEQIIEVQVPQLILEETVAMMKLAPHEHTQTT